MIQEGFSEGGGWGAVRRRVYLVARGMRQGWLDGKFWVQRKLRIHRRVRIPGHYTALWIPPFPPFHFPSDRFDSGAGPELNTRCKKTTAWNSRRASRQVRSSQIRLAFSSPSPRQTVGMVQGRQRDKSGRAKRRRQAGAKRRA
jgi:hypothetical protein